MATDNGLNLFNIHNKEFELIHNDSSEEAVDFKSTFLKIPKTIFTLPRLEKDFLNMIKKLKN